ncbi:hypothetical protein [uncultured Eubacterium sp.]|uniref:hypothetical protein n=1 Tax=uncultured Eubacterium sp. TaxID=165185 RepID=UPI002670E911|nr:hypothetical protein [uncultured Eubacterium sp.]
MENKIWQFIRCNRAEKICEKYKQQEYKKLLLIEIEKMVFIEKKPFFLLPLKLIKIDVSNVI